MIAHYKRSTNGDGFTLAEFTFDLNNYMKEFNEIEGSIDSRFAIVLLSSDVSHTYYNKIIFMNELDECNNLLFSWLCRSNTTKDMWDITHFYGMILDLKNQKELGYGDSWNNGSASWHKFNGVSLI